MTTAAMTTDEALARTIATESVRLGIAVRPDAVRVLMAVLNGREREVKSLRDQLAGVSSIECPSCHTSIRARLADDPAVERERVAEVERLRAAVARVREAVADARHPFEETGRALLADDVIAALDAEA